MIVSLYDCTLTVRMRVCMGVNNWNKQKTITLATSWTGLRVGESVF